MGAGYSVIVQCVVFWKTSNKPFGSFLQRRYTHAEQHATAQVNSSPAMMAVNFQGLSVSGGSVGGGTKPGQRNGFD